MKKVLKVIALSMVLFVGGAFILPTQMGTIESHAAENADQQEERQPSQRERRLNSESRMQKERKSDGPVVKRKLLQ